MNHQNKKSAIIGFSLSDFMLWPNKSLDFLLPNLKKAAPQAQAVELSYHWPIKEILKNNKYLQKYKFRSFHLPTERYKKWVDELNKYQHLLNLNYLVVHPNRVHSWPSLLKSQIPILVENMDKYKKVLIKPRKWKIF